MKKYPQPVVNTPPPHSRGAALTQCSVQILSGVIQVFWGHFLVAASPRPVWCEAYRGGGECESYRAHGGSGSEGTCGRVVVILSSPGGPKVFECSSIVLLCFCVSESRCFKRLRAYRRKLPRVREEFRLYTYVPQGSGIAHKQSNTMNIFKTPGKV